MCLSFVIPAYNEEAYIKKTIQRIADLTANKFEHEIIVIDNFSNDKTAEILREFKSILTIRTNEKITVSAARNIGWKLARFKNVAFIDADMLLTESWIDEFVNNITDLTMNPNQITGYRCLISENPGWIERSWFTSLGKTKPTYINSANLITTKVVLNNINGFDESLITGEDVDFSKRAISSGANLNLNEDYAAHHEGYPKTIRDFFYRERWHGTGDLKSFSTFLKSKVAIFSFVSIGLLVSSIFLGVIGLYAMAIICLFLYVSLNLYAVLLRFNIKNLSNLINLTFLQMLYGFARTLSILKRSKI